MAPRIPTSTRETPLSGRAAGVPIPEGIFSQQQQAQRGLAQTVSGIGDRLLAIDAKTEFSRFQGNVAAAKQEFANFRQENPDHNTWGPEWKRKVAGFTSDAAKVRNPRAKRAISDTIAQSGRFWDLEVQGQIGRAIVAQRDQQSINRINEIMTDPSIVGDETSTGAQKRTDFIDDVIDEMVEDGVWTPEEGKARKLSAKSGISSFEKSQAQDLLDLEQNEAIELALLQVDPETKEIDLAAAAKVIDQFDLPEKMTNEAIRAVEFRAKQIEGQRERAETQLQTDTMTTLYSQISGDEVPADVINREINRATLPDENGLRALTITQAESMKAILAQDQTIDTSDDTRLAIENIISSVRAGQLSLDGGVDAYTALAKDVARSEGGGFLQRIVQAGEAAKSTTEQKKGGLLKERGDFLQTSISRQPNLFAPEQADEILGDFAKKAVIELNDKFRDMDFEDSTELDLEVARLIRKYTFGDVQLQRAVNFRNIESAQSAKEQTAAIIAVIQQLRSEGSNAEAAVVANEAARTGLLEVDAEGNIIETETSGEKKPTKSLLDRIFDSVLKR